MKKLASTIVIALILGQTAYSVGAFNAKQLRPDVLVVGHGWCTKAPSPSWGDLSIDPSNESFGNRNEHYNRRNFPVYPDHSYTDELSAAAGPLPEEPAESVEFIYTAQIQNAGRLEIRAILWDYVFLDPETNHELSRHTFYSERRLSADETRTLIAFSKKPPTWVISATMLAREDGETYQERVEIRAITYSDGTVWKAAH